MDRFNGRPCDFYPSLALGLAPGVAIGKRIGKRIVFACDAVFLRFSGPSLSLRLRRGLLWSSVVWGALTYIKRRSISTDRCVLFCLQWVYVFFLFPPPGVEVVQRSLLWR